MTSHGRTYPSTDDVIIPWNRRYTFPTTDNKAEKVTSRIQPKTSGPFLPTNQIQIDLPAQGYLNPINTFIQFDVTLSGVTQTDRGTRFENNIQSIFSRCEIRYGSTPLEEIHRSNSITRALTEWTATAGQTFDQTSINEGIGNVTAGNTFNATTGANLLAGALSNIRQRYIQGVDSEAPASGGFGTVNSTRRYCIQPITGLLQQRKLIPVKYMANQLSLILTLAPATQCIFGLNTTAATYSVSNVNMICETLNFDPTFDENFLEGLRNGGIPIKFSTWRSYGFSTEQNNNFQIAERAKSVKSIFAMLKRSNPTYTTDSGAMPFMPGAVHTLLDYQYQIGTKYYPASPVQLGTTGTATFGDPSVSANVGISNGGAEAYIELAKALYTVGNYQISSAVNAFRWGHGVATGLWLLSTNQSTLPTYTAQAEEDFERDSLYNTSGAFIVSLSAGGANSAGQLGSQCFAQAVSLETAASADYSGLNAEEASTIILRNRYSAKPGSVAAGCTVETAFDTVVFTYIDKMIVLGENNTLTLLE